MKEVPVYLPAQICRLYGIERPTSANGFTVGEVIDDLDTRYAGLRDRLCEEGNLRPYVVVFVGEERADLQTPIPVGKEVRVVPAVAGGSAIYVL